MSELPPPGRPLRVAEVNLTASEAVSFLTVGGRTPALETKVQLEDGAQEFRLWQPNVFLVQSVMSLSPGCAVDLGCGAGREAVFLASERWRVFAVDNLPDALLRGKRFAARYELEQNIEWLHHPSSIEWTSVSLLTAFFFFDQTILTEAIQWLPSGATVMIEAFTDEHANKFGKPGPTRRVASGELPKLFPRLEAIIFDEGWRENGRHTARFIGKCGHANLAP
jgi:SAM-dependent methyltransferase